MGNKSSKVDNKEPKQTKLKVGDVVGGRVIKSINKHSGNITYEDLPPQESGGDSGKKKKKKKVKWRSEEWKAQRRKEGKWYLGKNRDRRKDETKDMESKEGFANAGKRGYKKVETQSGESSEQTVVDTGDSTEVVNTGGKNQEEIIYRTKGKDSDQQATKKITDQDGNVTYEKQETTNKGGTYKEYGKDSQKAQSFRDAFAEASKAGLETFTWNGLKYSTKKK